MSSKCKGSKRKPNGNGSVHRIQEAVRKWDCSVKEFFELAGQFVGAPESFSLHEETKRFERVTRLGIIVVPDFRVPDHVLEFAEQVLEVKNPRIHFRHLADVR